MKKHVILFVLFVAATLFGCKEASNDFPVPTLEPTFLEVRKSIASDNTGAVVMVDIATNCEDWSAVCEADWVTLTEINPLTPGQLMIQIKANTLMDERDAIITITADEGKLTKNLQVIQFGTTKVIKFIPPTTSIDGLGQEFSFDVITNCPEIKHTIEAAAADWLTLVEPAPTSRAFSETTTTMTFAATINETEAPRKAEITFEGLGLGLGAVAKYTVTQAVNVELSELNATLIEYTGNEANSLAYLFDKDFATFGETGYGLASAVPDVASTNLDVAVFADGIYSIEFYPRGYVEGGALGQVNNYPADLELWVDKGAGFVKITDVQIRGNSDVAIPAKRIYPGLSAGQIPYKIYEGAALTDVIAVRFVIKNGNSNATGENNQFWNGSEIKFMGVPAAAPPVPPAQVTVTGATYDWETGPAGDGNDITVLYDGIKSTTNYWQSSYGGYSSSDPTNLVLELGAATTNVNELRYYIRHSGKQVPTKFAVWVDPGTGTYVLAKSFTFPSTTWAVLPSYTSIKLDTPVTAKNIKLVVETTGDTNAMHFCASEIEVYKQD